MQMNLSPSKAWTMDDEKCRWLFQMVYFGFSIFQAWSNPFQNGRVKVEVENGYFVGFFLCSPNLNLKTHLKLGHPLPTKSFEYVADPLHGRRDLGVKPISNCFKHTNCANLPDQSKDSKSSQSMTGWQTETKIPHLPQKTLVIGW